MLLRALAISLLLGLSACATNAPLTKAENSYANTTKLSFLDISKFDRDLSAALKNQPAPIEVAFYDNVSPNSVPERLQKWMAVVEANGGKILVDPPPSETSTRSVFAALSLIGTLISSIKKIEHYRSEQIYDAVKGRNAVISLERNDKGEVFVKQINFVKRTP
jgi:hypothetical protein